jgi:hypothetical protein
MVAIALQIILSVVFGVTVVLLAGRTPLIHSDGGRWLLAIGVGCMVACCPMFDILFLTDKIVAILLGAAGLNRMFAMAFGPTQYNIIRGFAPMLLEARRSMYRMQAQVARATA